MNEYVIIKWYVFIWFFSLVQFLLMTEAKAQVCISLCENQNSVIFFLKGGESENLVPCVWKISDFLKI